MPGYSAWALLLIPRMQLARTDPASASYTAEQHATAHRGARALAWCAIGLVPLFALLDAVVFPAHMPRFLYWRLVTIGVAVLALVLLRTSFGERRALLIGMTLPIVVGLDVDAMTVVAGREASPYYVGVIVVLLAASLILPWPPAWAAAISLLLVGGYAVGMLATGPVTNAPLFVTNVLLLSATAVLVVVGATVSARLRRREFQSRMALDAHARRQEGVARLGQLALGGVDAGALMERAAALVASTLGVDYAAILELQPDGAKLLLRAGAGWPAGLVGQTAVGTEPRSLARYTLETSEPVVLNELATETRFSVPRLLRDQGVVSGVNVAVARNDRPFGIVAAYACRPWACTQEEVDFLQAVARVLTTAIVRHDAASALAVEAQAASALARVGRELISSLDTPVLLERLCQRAAEALDVDFSSTWLLQPDGAVYVPISAYGLPADTWDTLCALRPRAESLASLLERLEREDVVEVTPTTQEHPFVADLLRRLAIGRMLFFALRRGDEVLGVQVSGRHGRTAPFTPQQQQLATGIAQLASMALTNAQLVEALERASQLKSEFVSTMSHELRTPLNVIIGYLDMLSDQPAPVEQAALLARVRTSGLELLDMIEATLNLNRIAAGQDIPQLAEVSIDELWNELSTEFAVFPRKTRATLRWEPVESLMLYTDRRRLKIILKNLVGNALKFTPEGEVVVRCTREEGRCVFVVADTGIGIPPSHLSVVFDMFRQVDSSDARSYSGAGLGLYIVKRLLDQLGGDVSVTSAPGHGSTFRVTLPIEAMPGDATAERPAAPALAPGAVERRVAGTPGRAHAERDVPAAPPARKQRILYADDLEVNRHLLRRCMARQLPDVEFYEARNGVEAVALFEAHTPDLVLLDLRMPEMDGWQATRRIRNLEAGRDVPIIAITVTASQGAEAYALHAGCNEFITKPISDYGALMARIEYWLERTRLLKTRPADAAIETLPLQTRLVPRVAPHADGSCALCRRPLAATAAHTR